MSLVLLPAVDVADGQAVRLVRGEAGSETAYGDPLTAALTWQESGAAWVHLVDLDAAFGRGSNRELIAEVVGRLDVNVEVSGGIRDEEALATALATGCARVNLGTAALESPRWVRTAIATHGEKIAVGLDVRGTRLAARGWTREGGELFEVLDRLDRDGCARYVVTDVTKDGTLTGPNLGLLRDVCAATDRPVVASGGVSSLADLRAIAELAPLGVEGTIVGKALYAGAFTLTEALREVAAVTSFPGNSLTGNSLTGSNLTGSNRTGSNLTGAPATPGRGGSPVRRVSSGGPWEGPFGYSRAVAAGPFVFVSGCTATKDGPTGADGDPYEQAISAFRVAERALAELELTLADVVQTRMYLVHGRDGEAVGRAHRELFGNTPPAATMVTVAGLIDSMLVVEVEVVAYRGTD